MNNDLISREALKKCAIPCVIHNGALTDLCVPLYQIDNAPTVEPCYQTTSCLDCKNYDKENYYCPRFCEVIRETTKEIKRQGEWIPCYVNFTDGSKPLFAYCKCSLCNKPATGVYKFCPNCGAEMKPKTCTNCETFGHDCGDCEVGDDD